MYEPPIDIQCTNYVAKQIESDRDDAVMLEITEQYGVYVDKEELAKALAYDRGQYDKGYQDGYSEGRQSILDELGIMPFQYEFLKMALSKNGEKNKEEKE